MKSSEVMGCIVDGYTGVNWAWVRVVYMPEMHGMMVRRVMVRVT